MDEDRVIIASVLSQDPDAFLDLHNFDPATTCNANVHRGKGRMNAVVTTFTAPKIELPQIPHSLPVAGTAKSSSPGRCFSKRGARLEVHMYILDLGAHNASNRHSCKWIQTSRSHQYLSHKENSRTSFSGGHVLGKISEAKSYKGRSPLKDISKMVIASSPEKTKTEFPEVAELGHHGRTSWQGIAHYQERNGKVKPSGGRQSLTQDDLEIEIENYGSA